MESASLLPHAAPCGASERLLLFAMRRMAAGGLNDAHATMALLHGFGRGFRRPLVLLRALMTEVSSIAGRTLAVAPCCCPRATGDERRLLDGIAVAALDPQQAHHRLSTLLAVRHCHVAVACAQAVATAWHDLGHPLEPSAD